MKKRVNLFDICLLVLVALLGLGAYALTHGDPPAPPSNAEPLLSDIRRNSDRYSDPEAMAKTENYMVEYRLLLEDGSLSDYEALAAPEDTILNGYNRSLLGTLKSLEEVQVGSETRVAATIELYSLFSKTAVASPGGSIIRVGNVFSLVTEQGSELGTGTVFWISH